MVKFDIIQTLNDIIIDNHYVITPLSYTYAGLSVHKHSLIDISIMLNSELTQCNTEH